MEAVCFTGMAKETIEYMFAIYEGKKRVVPIDMGAGELSPPYVLRIFRQFGFTDVEIERLLS